MHADLRRTLTQVQSTAASVTAIIKFAMLVPLRLMAMQAAIWSATAIRQRCVVSKVHSPMMYFVA